MKRATVIALFIVGLSGILSACTSDEGPNGSDGGPSDSGIDASDVRVDTRQDTGPPDAEPDTEPDMGPDVEPDTRPDTDETGEDSGTDTGPNCSLDTDADGLDNCAEAELCTSPTDGDTDNDGISDFEELEEGTDPCNPDTDNDGADDPVELEVGLNPNKPSTFDDGILDENRWRVNACAAPEDPDEDFTGTIDYYESDKANYKIGLPPGFSNYEQLTLGNDAPIAAGVYGDSLTSVYGFIVSKNAEGGRTAPDQSLRDTVRPEVIEIAGNDQDNLIFGTNGGAFTTHDGKRAAIGRYLIETPTDKSTAKVREELLLGLDAFGKTDLVGGSSLPSTAGQAHGTFRIFVSVVFRANTSGPSQALVSAAVTPASVYDSRNQVRFQMDDLTNTTNISEEVDGTLVGCETFLPSSDIPKANFYWVLDQSTSMDPDNATVASFGQSFVNQVQNTQLDYSLGVTNMDPGNNGRLYNPWTTNAQQFSSDIQNGVISCTGWSCDCCDEYGLEVAMKGIRYMRGLTPQSPPPVEKIPSDASLITIFMTDEPANSVQDGVSEQTYLDFYTGPGDTTVFSITGTQDCGADGPAYQNVALATGGKFASVCSGDLTGILSDIIFAATGESTEYQLSETPVSASLSVFQESDQDPTTSQFVPRNREDGFEYFAQDNSVAFFGSYRPEPSDGDYSEDFVAVRYEYFIDRCKESGNGANNCADD